MNWKAIGPVEKSIGLLEEWYAKKCGVEKPFDHCFELGDSFKFELVHPGRTEVFIMDIRKLYDFFDDQEICVEVSIDSEKEWEYIVTTDLQLVANCGYKTRKEAEDTAFEYAFQVLELELKSK